MKQLILDVMGGDSGPRAILDGAQAALRDLRLPLVLVGDRTKVEEWLGHHHFKALHQALERGAATWVQASETIEMHDTIRAVRSKPGATINVGCRLAADAWKNWKAGRGEPSAFISAGHSGAMMASALLSMGRLSGVERPGIAVRLPTLSPDGCVVIDVGANIECKPEHLRDFAVMGAVYAQVERKSEGPPRVGVLSNGEERSKGTEQTRAALALIDALPCFAAPEPGAPGARPPVGRFLGYTEGKDIFVGHVDVVVTDGFVGNVVLKSLEGLGSAIVTLLKTEAKRNPMSAIGFLLAGGTLTRMKRRLDYAEYGAAPLLGVAGYAFVCHGRSNAKAIKNALLRAQSALACGLVEHLEDALGAAAPEGSEASAPRGERRR